MLSACVSIFNLDGMETPSAVIDDFNGLFGLSGPFKFNRSSASSSASENCRKCLGRNGTGVETREVKNYAS